MVQSDTSRFWMIFGIENFWNSKVQHWNFSPLKRTWNISFGLVNKSVVVFFLLHRHNMKLAGWKLDCLQLFPEEHKRLSCLACQLHSWNGRWFERENEETKEKREFVPPVNQTRNVCVFASRRSPIHSIVILIHHWFHSGFVLPRKLTRWPGEWNNDPF